jgi:rhomboid-like protein
MKSFRALVVPFIIVINVGVYLVWNYGGHARLEFMEDNFLTSWTLLEQGRYWTLLTSEFSQNWIWHLVINMFVLNSFGTLLEQVLGRMRFLGFYLVAGVVSSLCHCLLSNFYLHQPEQMALGASGAIAGLVLVFSLIFPREKILLMGIIPVPALWGALAFVGLDLWGLTAQAHGGGLPIGHGAHLGGALTGVLYYFLFLRRRIRRREID